MLLVLLSCPLPSLARNLVMNGGKERVEGWNSNSTRRTDK